MNSVGVVADPVPDADPDEADHIPQGEAERIDTTVDVYTLTVNYWKDTAGGEKAAETFRKIYIDGDYFNVVSPDVYGYTPDKELVDGNITEDTTIDVIYEREYFNLVIHYIYEDGSKAFEDYRGRLYVGESFNVSSPVLGGYTAGRNEVYGTMQYAHLAFTVVYVGNTTVIDDYVTPLGLPSVMSDAGECFE